MCSTPIDFLLPRRVFRETGNPGHVEFVHDLLHELPYADLSATRRRSLHRRVGELLERRRAKGRVVAPAVLAEHFRDGDERPRAFSYTMEAAEAALNAYAFNNAAIQLKDAQQLLPADADAATRYRLWDMLGTAFGSSGQLDDAIAAYTHALDHAGDHLDRATLTTASVRRFSGKAPTDDSGRHFRLALSEVGYPLPHSAMGLVSGLWRSFVYFHLIPSWLALDRSRPDFDRRVAIATTTYHRMATSCTNSVLSYCYSSYRIAALAKQSGKPELIAAGYSKIFWSCGMFSLGSFMNDFMRRAEKAAESCRRVEVMALTKAHIGGVHYYSGRLDQAEADLREAIGTLDKVGDWFGLFSHHTLRHLYAVRGDIRRELAEAELEIETGTARGDAEALAYGQYGKADALARAGRVEEAHELMIPAVAVLIARDSFALNIAYGHLGFVRLQASDYSGARAALEKSRDRTIRRYCPFRVGRIHFPLLVESLLGPSWADVDDGPSRAVALKAWREARVARFVGWRYPNYEAHALRVSGRAAYALGKIKEAARLLRTIDDGGRETRRPLRSRPCTPRRLACHPRTVPTNTAAAVNNCFTNSEPSSRRPSGSPLMPMNRPEHDSGREVHSSDSYQLRHEPRQGRCQLHEPNRRSIIPRTRPHPTTLDRVAWLPWPELRGSGQSPKRLRS